MFWHPSFGKLIDAVTGRGEKEREERNLLGGPCENIIYARILLSLTRAVKVSCAKEDQIKKFPLKSRKLPYGRKFFLFK